MLLTYAARDRRPRLAPGFLELRSRLGAPQATWTWRGAADPCGNEEERGRHGRTEGGGVEQRERRDRAEGEGSCVEESAAAGSDSEAAYDSDADHCPVLRKEGVAVAVAPEPQAALPLPRRWWPLAPPRRRPPLPTSLPELRPVPTPPAKVVAAAAPSHPSAGVGLRLPPASSPAAPRPTLPSCFPQIRDPTEAENPHCGCPDRPDRRAKVRRPWSRSPSTTPGPPRSLPAGGCVSRSCARAPPPTPPPWRRPPPSTPLLASRGPFLPGRDAVLGTVFLKRRSGAGSGGVPCGAP
uniref:Uncharacterized protein n=1 Tax=Setaria viridis TaxID=4556 RepID=A0A4U6TTX9_SETVI|nr:hypothetical protein SEVIR_7G094400v2 [Setaria viridis]